MNTKADFINNHAMCKADQRAIDIRALLAMAIELLHASVIIIVIVKTKHFQSRNQSIVPYTK